MKVIHLIPLKSSVIFLQSSPLSSYFCTHIRGDTYTFSAIDCLKLFTFFLTHSKRNCTNTQELFSAFWLSACPFVHSAFMCDCLTTLHGLRILKYQLSRAKHLSIKISSTQYTLNFFFFQTPSCLVTCTSIVHLIPHESY